MNWLQRSRRVMPGGVSSPVRAFRAVHGEPPVVARASGAEIVDTEGQAYVDLVMSWGPLILGHAHPAVVESLRNTAPDGLTFGATCRQEIELAETILSHYAFADRVRFVSSGTEACMSAVRLARGATGRKVVVKFEGCYHGHVDSLLVKGGSGLATFGTPSSAGVPEELASLTEVLPLDDDAALRDLFARRGSEIALVAIEPLPANAGLLPQRPEFLRLLRELTREHGALLLFDEVISGFRVGLGGMVAETGIEPDLVTLGKIIGGGLPVGAYLGPAALMDQLAPEGAVYQAGTLSGNPLAMGAGLTTIKRLERGEIYEDLEAKGAYLEAGLTRALAESDVSATVVRRGSILWLSLQAGPAPRAFHSIEDAGPALYNRLHAKVLARGTWMAPSAYEVAFVSAAHTEEHLDRAIDAFAGGLRECLEARTA